MERAPPLAGAAPAHEIPFARQHHAGDELARLGAELVLENLGASPAAGFPHQPGHLGGAACPRLGAGAADVPRLGAVRHVGRLGVPDLHGRSVTVEIITEVSNGIVAGVCVARAFVLCVFSRVLVTPGGVLQVLEQRLEGAVVHVFQPREGQRRMIARGQEDDRIAGRSRLQFVVQQPFVQNADVFRRQVREVHRDGRPNAAASLADADRGPGEEAQHFVNVPVGHGLAVEAGILVRGQRPRHAVSPVAAGREQFAAVLGHRQVGEVRAFPYQVEQCEDAWPCAVALVQGGAVSGVPLQPFQQAVQAVALVVEGVLARQQLPGLRKEDHHQPHRHPAGGAVDVGGINAGALLLQHVAVSLDEHFDRLAHALAQHLRQLRLPLAGVANGLQERRVAPLALRDPEVGTQQRPQRRDLGRKLAFLKPQFQVPFTRSVVVQAREQEPPLPAVGQEREPLVARPQPSQRLAHDAAAPAPAQLPAVVQENGKRCAVAPLPEVARPYRFAGHRAAAPRGRDVAAARPGPLGADEAAHALQHERDERRDLTAAVEDRVAAPTQLLLGVVVERGRQVSGERVEPGSVQQQPAMTQILPTG